MVRSVPRRNRFLLLLAVAAVVGLFAFLIVVAANATMAAGPELPQSEEPASSATSTPGVPDPSPSPTPTPATSAPEPLPLTCTPTAPEPLPTPTPTPTSSLLSPTSTLSVPNSSITEPTPAPTPALEPGVSTDLGGPRCADVTPSMGNTLTSGDGKVIVSIPAGAVSEDVRITYDPKQVQRSTGFQFRWLFSLDAVATNRDDARSRRSSRNWRSLSGTATQRSRA
jgi:hypothetical protein